jgi:predicted enzyme related to lactoylglutathione lyase
MSNYPGTFLPIGISVPDVENAVEFYSNVMGWYQILKPTVTTGESETNRTNVN